MNEGVLSYTQYLDDVEDKSESITCCPSSPPCLDLRGYPQPVSFHKESEKSVHMRSVVCGFPCGSFRV